MSTATAIRLGFGLAVVAIAVGCKPAPSVFLTDAGPAKLPAGWTLASNSTYGVSIGLVPGWKYGVDTAVSMIDLTTSGGGSNPSGQMPPVDPQFQKFADDTKKEAEAQEQAELKKLEDDGIVINVIDLGSRALAGEARTRYYVHLKKDSAPTMKEAVDDLKKSLLGDVVETPVTLPVGPATLLRAHWKTRAGDDFYSINYVMVDGDNVYRIKFIETGSSGAIDPIADQVAQSFRVARK